MPKYESFPYSPSQPYREPPCSNHGEVTVFVHVPCDPFEAEICVNCGLPVDNPPSKPGNGG